ncbi:type II secretion system protein [bacterium]|nr:type II secretion system protein [bacterium]
MVRKTFNHGISRLGLRQSITAKTSLPYEGGLGWVPSRKGKRAAFTLAEVLITLAIIGVVAAMTLPTLIAKINEKADSNQKAVIEAKLIQGLNMLDLHGGMNDTYS